MLPVYSSNGFGNGLGSLAPGLNSDVFGSLQRSLADYMNEQQIQPFIQEVRSMAKERFGFGENQGSNFGPGVGDATLKVPDVMLPPLTDTMGEPPVAAGTAPMISNPAPMRPSERDPDNFRDAFNAFKNTLRPEGDMGRYIAPGETITYDQFVELGRPANLAAAEAAGFNSGFSLPAPINFGGAEETAFKLGGLGGGLVEKDPNPRFMGRPDLNSMADFDNNSLLPGGPAQLLGVMPSLPLPPAMAEADILPAYERARAAAAERRAGGDLSQVVLPGEAPFEDFRRLNLMPGRGLGVQRNFAEGGPVMMNRDPMAAGLGSFLASNIDEFGRNGDTEVIHATKSEVVLPKGMVDNPEVRRTVRDLFEQTGRDMQEYTIGSGEMNVNPMTGYEEAFDLIGGIKDIFKKAAPVLLPIATTFMFPGMSPFLSGALAGGVGSLIQGGSIEDAFKAGIKGGLVSSATNALFNSGQRNPFKPVDPGVEKAFTPRDVNMGDLAGKAQTAGGTVKDFFVNPSQTAQQISGLTPEAFANLGDASKAELFKQAGASGGLNLGRTIAGGLGALALAGGFDEIEAEEVKDPYPYSSRELMEMYPERYRTGPIIAPRRKTREDEDPVYMRYAAKGGEMEFPRRQGYISGPGTETSDDIPAMLSDGEFVMTARAVRGAGDGSRKDGVKKMYDIMRAFEGGVVS